MDKFVSVVEKETVKVVGEDFNGRVVTHSQTNKSAGCGMAQHEAGDDSHRRRARDVRADIDIC